MALWQVEFDVVPRRALPSHGGRGASHRRDAQAWSSHALPLGYANRLDAITSTEPTATTELQTWGPEDGNRIEIALEGGRVREVRARVDVRKLDAKFGAALIQLVRTADAVLVRSDGLVVEPQIAAYAAALRSSEAWRYNRDALPELATRDEDDE